MKDDREPLIPNDPAAGRALNVTPRIEGGAPRTARERTQLALAEREQATTALTWMQVLNAAARPFMTVMFATAFTVVCTMAWYRHDITAEAYMNGIGPIVATLVGFWFGERAAQNRQEDKDSE
ncbi:hypothetical protein ATN89_17390 [Comamonas thiooxydans]|uniref:hypothetical protein n=1 Tax=Comamonas thiooxydans TaxID=363952 RepID=UPI0007C4656B|nr:hypothetical protein [Comamonas thiooxydans]OAD82858.1 hypothetical protein ATN89_17390 [Comamonas thiooxydans]